MGWRWEATRWEAAPGDDREAGGHGGDQDAGGHRATGMPVDPEKTRLEAAPRATGMMVDPEGNRLEVSLGLTRILADQEASRLTTGLRPAIEAMEFRSLPSAPEVMKFGLTMEEKYLEKKYYFSK